MAPISSISAAQDAYAAVAGARATQSASRASPAASADPVRSAAAAAPTGSASSDRLSAPEQRLLEQLKQTDRVVRAHEQAHLSAGAGLVRGAASFSLQTGPDDRSYAVAGEVSIDTSPGSTPQETVAKAAQIRAAALAPADPSAQDLRVAALASRLESEALIELATQQTAARSAPTRADASTAFYRDVEQERGSRSVGSGLDVYA